MEAAPPEDMEVASPEDMEVASPEDMEVASAAAVLAHFSSSGRSYKSYYTPRICTSVESLLKALYPECPIFEI